MCGPGRKRLRSEEDASAAIIHRQLNTGYTSDDGGGDDDGDGDDGGNIVGEL
jgi:hypothetical protein